MYSFVAMIVSIIIGSAVYYLVDMLCFHYRAMGIPTLGISIYSKYLVVYMFSHPCSLDYPCYPYLIYIVKYFSHHLHFWTLTLEGIFCTLKYHLFSPLQIKKWPRASWGPYTTFRFDYSFFFSTIMHITLEWSDTQHLSLLSLLWGANSIPPCTIDKG